MDFLSAGSVLSTVAGAFVATFGWVFKRAITQLDEKIKLHDAMLQEKSDDLAAFKLHVAETYVTSSALEKAIDRFTRSLDAVFKKLDAIDVKLDAKLDRETYYNDGGRK